MIRRITSFVLKSLVNALRDNIMIYGAIFPIVLAFVMSLFIPSVESMKLTVAVEKNVEQRVMDQLKNYAEVEIYETQELVKERVERNDDMAGIIREGDKYIILLEGNEAGEAEEVANALMDIILSRQPTAEFRHVSLEKTSSSIKEISGSLLLLTAILIGGYIVGFSIVDEKETRAIHALAVSPLKVSEFILSHTILCLIIGIILAVIPTFILAGMNISYAEVVIAIVASTGVGLILGFTIGGIANNLISAIAVVKFLMLIFLGVPIGSLFTPQNFHWVYYLFPHYWAFQAYQNIFSGENQHIGFMTSSLITLVSSFVVLILLVPMLKKRLNLR